MAQTRPSPTLSRGFTRLGRFLAPYGIVEAFGFCTENWPYGGVTNKEFQIALKYLKAETHYSTDLETLGALLGSRPARCVALLPGHFIAIVNGEIVGRDTHLRWSSSTTVYCHWTFRSR